MKVIDARSGQVVACVGRHATLYSDGWMGGKIVDWGNGEWLQLLSVEPGLLSAWAGIRTTTRNENGSLVTQTHRVPLAVRWTHPKYFLEHVAFIPS